MRKQKRYPVPARMCFLGMQWLWRDENGQMVHYTAEHPPWRQPPWAAEVSSKKPTRVYGLRRQDGTLGHCDRSLLRRFATVLQHENMQVLVAPHGYKLTPEGIQPLVEGSPCGSGSGSGSDE